MYHNPYRSLKSAFMAGYESKLGDEIPSLLGLTREAWLVGAYFMRADLPAPKRVERGPCYDWEGGNGFTGGSYRSLFVDGAFYINVSCNGGTKTLRIWEGANHV